MYRKPNLFTFHPVSNQANFVITSGFTAFGWYYLYPPSETTLVSPRLIYVDTTSLPKYIGYSTNLPIGCFSSTYQPVGPCEISYLVASPQKLGFTHEQQPSAVSIDNGVYIGRMVASSQGQNISKPIELSQHIDNQAYLLSTEVPSLLLLDDYTCIGYLPTPAELAAIANTPAKVAYGKFNHHQVPITSMVSTQFFGLPIKGQWQELSHFIDSTAVPTVINPVTGNETPEVLPGTFTAIATGLQLILTGLKPKQLVSVQLPSMFGQLPLVINGTIDSFDFEGTVTFEPEVSNVSLDFTNSLVLAGNLTATKCQQGNKMILVT
jgi:hypothetical protein